jgi:hypothetical protein
MLGGQLLVPSMLVTMRPADLNKTVGKAVVSSSAKCGSPSDCSTCSQCALKRHPHLLLGGGAVLKTLTRNRLHSAMPVKSAYWLVWTTAFLEQISLGRERVKSSFGSQPAAKRALPLVRCEAKTGFPLLRSSDSPIELWSTLDDVIGKLRMYSPACVGVIKLDSAGASGW